MTLDILLPPGRQVQGDLYKPNTTNMEGHPLVYKSGPQAGQPREEYFFAVAIPKQGESSWDQTEWGQQIKAYALQQFPNGETQRPDFAWKIIDGDSEQFNQGSPPKRWCDHEGFPGHWIVRSSSGYPPTICDRNGEKQLTEPGMVKNGDYIQVFVAVNGNGSAHKPGLYYNNKAVAFIGYGERIETGGIDTRKIGFGQGPIPPGVKDTPPAGNFNPASHTPPPAAHTPPPAAHTPPPAAPEALQPPAPQQPPAAPPAAPAKTMTAKAGGIPYEQYIASGWTDALLVQHEYMEV